MQADSNSTRELLSISGTVMGLASAMSLISLMALFVGGGQAGTDLRALMILEIGLTPIALIIVVVNLYWFQKLNGWSAGMRTLWRATPQWLVFIFFLLNSLVAFGEIAFVVVVMATDGTVLWHEHAPLICMLMSTAAYITIHARLHTYPGSLPALAGRWM